MCNAIRCFILMLLLFNTGSWAHSQDMLDGVRKSWDLLPDFYAEEFNTLNLTETEAGSRKVESVRTRGNQTSESLIIEDNANAVTETEVLSQELSNAKKRPAPASGKPLTSIASIWNDRYFCKVSKTGEEWELESLEGAQAPGTQAIRSGGMYLPGTNLPLFLVLPEYGLFSVANDGQKGDLDRNNIMLVPNRDSIGKAISMNGFDLTYSSPEIKTVTLSLDESNQWMPSKVIVDFINRGFPAIATMTIDYNTTEFDFPVPSLINLEIKSEAQDSTTTKKMTFSSIPYPETRFTLTHYGIPEPNIQTVTGGWGWIIWATVGLILFVLGVLLYRGKNNVATS